MLRPDDFFELKKFEHKVLFKDIEFVWATLSRIKKRLKPKIKK